MKNIKLTTSCIFLLLCISGCRKFVELEAPSTQLVTTNVFQRDENVNSAIAGLYIQMVEQNLMPLRMAVLTGLSADELKTNYVDQVSVYENGLDATSAETNSIWTVAFNVIFQANTIFDGCQTSSTLSPSVKQQVMAEAMFIRAYWNFYLVNLYGDIPLVISTNYTENATILRSPVAKVYEQIISDLKYAQDNLNENYVAGNSITTTTDRVRPNKATATALLARVYLYTHNYVDAETQATAVINQADLFSIVGLNEVFLKNSREAIWQLEKAAPANDVNTYEGNYFILTGAPLTNLQKSSTISSQLLNAFESNDQRKLSWIGLFSDGSVTPQVNYYYPYKYHVDKSSEITECSTVFRLAEQYLIRAEARAQLSRLGEAIDDLDVIRNRAGISLIKATNPTIGKDALLAAILKERQCELFTEWGHRWLDLKRTETIDAVMNVVAPLKGSTWNSAKQLWPIPQKEIGNDPNLVQNPSYN